jgi:lysophospholipase L1-like esterase
VSTAVQAAQVGIVDNVTIFSGGDLDSFNATYRQADNTHPNDTGAAAMATAVYNAMVASGY